MSIDRPRMARELIRWSVIGSDLKTYHAPDCCFDAISSREPVSTSLENALIRRAQPVADAGFGQYELRTLRIGLDLLPELAHVNPQILRIRQLVP